jgi:hypothetical protein
MTLKLTLKLEELFFKFVSTQFSVDIEKVKENWKEFMSNENKVEIEKSEVFHCIYEYSRNPRKGEVCGKKIKSGEYCSSHKKREKKIVESSVNESKQKTTKESVKESTKESTKESVKESVKESKQKTKKEKVEPVDQTLIVKLYPKVGKYIHPLTRLAFFSKEHKVVYAKLSLSDTIIPLCDKDIETCKRYLFRYDTSLFKNETV